MFYTVINHKIAFYNLIHSKEEKIRFVWGLFGYTIENKISI